MSGKEVSLRGKEVNVRGKELSVRGKEVRLLSERGKIDNCFVTPNQPRESYQGEYECMVRR